MNLSASNLSKAYGTQKALDNFNLSVDGFNCLAFIGPSGGGKSTALRHLCGLEIPDSGQIMLNNKAVPTEEKELLEYRKSIGVVFQSYNLFPHLSALQNITLPLIQVHNQSLEQAEEQAMKLLTRFGLSEHSFKKPSALSGGQSQRVAIARALAPDPDILFFDEPTSALDPEMTAEVLEVIESLIQEGKKAVLVTHEMGFAHKAADEVAFIANGNVIEQAQSNEFFQKPKTEITKRFLSKVLKY